MKHFRFLVISLLGLIGLSASAAPAGVATVEQLYPQLDQILRKAIDQSPQMVSRALDLEIAEHERIALRAGLLPSLGGYLRHHESREKRADQPGRLSVPKDYYDVSITQPLYHWGERSNTARMGQIRKEMAQGNYRQGYHLLAQEVRSQYLRLIAGKLRLNRSELVHRSAANQLKLGEQRLAQKVISDAQMFTIRITAERSEIDVERARFDHENAKASFSRLTGVPLLADADIPDSIPAVRHEAGAIEGLLAGYLGQKNKPTFEAVNYLASLEIERLNLANQRTRLKPKFNLVVGISQDEQKYTTIGQKYQVNSQYAGISANWTIFDGFSARSGVRSSLARLQQMENDYRALDERLAQQAQSQARLAGFHARYCSINDRFVESAEGNLKAKRDEFSRGVVSEEEVSTAEIGVQDSQLNAFSSRIDYYVQVGEFLGTIVEDPVLANLPSAKK